MRKIGFIQNNTLSPLPDDTNERLLTPSGDSIISPDKYIEKLLFGEDVSHFFVEESQLRNKNLLEDAKLYTDKHIEEHIEASEVDCQNVHTISYSEDTQYEHYNELETKVLSSPRLKKTDKEFQRIAIELDYLFRVESCKLFLEVTKLIDKFKEDGVVWGVGRGSSCACYILYLLEVHDVDSLQYNIPFKEFSKEDVDELLQT